MSSDQDREARERAEKVIASHQQAEGLFPPQCRECCVLSADDDWPCMPSLLAHEALRLMDVQIDSDHEWAQWCEKWKAAIDLVGNQAERAEAAEAEVSRLRDLWETFAHHAAMAVGDVRDGYTVAEEIVAQHEEQAAEIDELKQERDQLRAELNSVNGHWPELVQLRAELQQAGANVAAIVDALECEAHPTPEREFIAQIVADLHLGLHRTEQENAQLRAELGKARGALMDIRQEIEICNWRCTHCNHDPEMKESDLYALVCSALGDNAAIEKPDLQLGRAMNDQQIKDAILNAVRATVVAHHCFSQGLSSTDPQQIERDAFWLAGKCEEAARKAMEGR